MKAPFAYFGGKSTIAELVWSLLGQPQRYIEPFFGSGAVLLNRVGYNQTKHDEIVNDKDGYISNVWRALRESPDEVAKFCDWPVNHADLCARRKYLVEHGDYLVEHLMQDDEWFDVKCAGYWIWSASCWIGSGLTRKTAIPHLTGNKGVHKTGKRPQLTGDKGVHKTGQIPHLTGDTGVFNHNIYKCFQELSTRLRYVKVVCGDWSRVCGGKWQDDKGVVGIFFDPPYSHEMRNDKLFDTETDCAQEVNKWCVSRGGKKTYRIVLAGYEGEHNNLEALGWSKIAWKAGGGYGNLGEDNQNRHKERLWHSPHCKGQGSLF